jgi:choline dehydrogenase-like flavoprotein
MTCKNAFDFVVIGGGLAGLVVATRLAEDPNITVGVLEAGQDVTQSLNTKVPGFAGRDLADAEVTWKFLSTPQPGANDRALFLPRGRSLGGSSNLHFMQLGRASAPEYDAFETLGSKGWNWQELLKYFKKSEKLAYSQDEQCGVKPELDFHGTSGPVFKTLPRWKNPMMQTYVKTCENLGILLNTDSANGNTVGVWSAPACTIHPETATRVSSATAYYEPNKTKQNLVVITGAHVTRIIFNGKVAEAVEYLKDGELQSVSVKKEVILSAGSFQTPQILELSGIGDEKILQSHGIPVVVHLPGVGRNYRKFVHIDSGV